MNFEIRTITQQRNTMMKTTYRMLSILLVAAVAGILACSCTSMSSRTAAIMALSMDKSIPGKDKAESILALAQPLPAEAGWEMPFVQLGGKLDYQPDTGLKIDNQKSFKDTTQLAGLVAGEFALAGVQKAKDAADAKSAAESAKYAAEAEKAKAAADLEKARMANDLKIKEMEMADGAAVVP